MSYTVLARRYRSQAFDEVIGQESIARTLQNAIKTDRVAHAYLFCGTRGVGKTTMSATLAIKAALMGKNVLVVTVDPARRLATSLGVKALGEEPLEITELLNSVVLKKTGEPLKGRLTAVMPNAKSALESFVAKLSTNPQTAEKITSNPIFKIVSQEFSGTQEYMAMERLYTLHQEGGYDCIILDTPPSRNTLAFLDAPERLTRFLEERLLKWLTIPKGTLFSIGLKKALSLLEKVTGSNFIPELLEFAGGLIEIKSKFTVKLKLMMGLLKSPKVGFILVAAPAPEMLNEIQSFLGSISRHGFRMRGMILNRTLGPLDFSQAPTDDLAFKLLASLHERETAFLNQLKTQTTIQLLAQIDERARDIHTLEDLFDVAQILA